MFKKNQMGSPCSPTFLADYFLGKCVKMEIHGIANGSCNCCTLANGTYYMGIWNASTLGGDTPCSTFAALSFLTPSPINCSCLQTVPGSFTGQYTFFWAENKCEEAKLYCYISLFGCVIVFGYAIEDLTHDADIRDKIRRLAKGEVVRFDAVVSVPDFCDRCDTSGAYADVSIVTCPDPLPEPDPVTCSQVAALCHTKSDESPGVTGWVTPGTLRFSGFEDCTKVNVDANTVEHWEWSRLNFETQSFQLEYRSNDSFLNPQCAFAFSSPIVDLYHLETGTQSNYGDPGILLRWDEVNGLPLNENTIELYVVGIIVAMRCWEGESQLTQSNLLTLKAVGLQLQQYQIFYKGTGGQSVHYVSPYCEVYMAGIFNGLIWEDSDLRQSGVEPVLERPSDTCFFNGSALSNIEYSLCDVSKFFTATFRVPPNR
jgi:hypothetical protein